MEKKHSENTIKTTLYLPDDLHAELKIQAAKSRTSMTRLVIRALHRELKRQENKNLDND